MKVGNNVTQPPLESSFTCRNASTEQSEGLNVNSMNEASKSWNIQYTPYEFHIPPCYIRVFRSPYKVKVPRSSSTTKAKGPITWNILWGCNNEIIVAREQTCGGVVTVYSMYSNAHILCQVYTELEVNCFSVLPPDVYSSVMQSVDCKCL